MSLRCSCEPTIPFMARHGEIFLRDLRYVRNNWTTQFCNSQTRVMYFRIREPQHSFLRCWFSGVLRGDVVGLVWWLVTWIWHWSWYSSRSNPVMAVCLFVCNHIAFGRWRPWHIPYTFPPRFFRNIKKQKQSRKSSSPLNKRKPPQKTTSTFTPPHHLTPRDLSSPPPPPLR